MTATFSTSPDTIESANVEADERAELRRLEADRARDRRRIAEHADGRRRALVRFGFEHSRSFAADVRSIVVSTTGIGIGESIDSRGYAEALAKWSESSELVRVLLEATPDQLGTPSMRANWQTLVRRCSQAQAALERFDAETDRLTAELHETHQAKRERQHEQAAQRAEERRQLIADARDAEATIKAAVQVLEAINMLQSIAQRAAALGVGLDDLSASYRQLQDLLNARASDDDSRTWPRLLSRLRLRR